MIRLAAVTVAGMAMLMLVWSGEMHESRDGAGLFTSSNEVAERPGLSGAALSSLPTLSEAQVVTLDESVLAAREELAEAIVEADVIEEGPYVPAAPREVVAVRVAAVPEHSFFAIVASFFPEYPLWAWSVLMCESGHNPGGALLMLTATGASGELTPWQIMPGNYRTMGEWPIAGDFVDQTRQARKWHDLIGGFAAWGGWSCA